MIQTMNNKENTLSMALKYIDKHSLSLPENTQTTMNAMFGVDQDASGLLLSRYQASTVFTVLAATNAATPQPSYCRHRRSISAIAFALLAARCTPSRRFALQPPPLTLPPPPSCHRYCIRAAGGALYTAAALCTATTTADAAAAA